MISCCLRIARGLRNVGEAFPSWVSLNFEEWVRGNGLDDYVVGTIAMDQTCKACGRRDKFNFHVPDDLWVAVVPPEHRNHVVCLSCFDDFAAVGRVDYATHLTGPLWLAGDAATFGFRIDTAI